MGVSTSHLCIIMAKQKTTSADEPTSAKAKRVRAEDRVLAKRVFVSGTMTAADIAVHFKVTHDTVSQWAREDNWDEERITNKVSPSQLIHRFNTEIESILNGTVDENGKQRKLTVSEIGIISKLTKSVKELRNSTDPQTIMEVLHGYMGHLSNVDLKLAQATADYALAYVKLKIKEAKEK